MKAYYVDHFTGEIKNEEASKVEGSVIFFESYLMWELVSSTLGKWFLDEEDALTCSIKVLRGLIAKQGDLARIAGRKIAKLIADITDGVNV